MSRDRESRKGGARDIARDRGVFMISVAAELAGMHPQTLRIYEARGLIAPSRSPKNTRLYSHRDVERLRRIQRLTTDLGMNLAGAERVLDLEAELEGARRRLEALEEQMHGMRDRMLAEVEAVRRSFKREIVPYREPGRSLVRARDVAPGKVFRIPIERGEGG